MTPEEIQAELDKYRDILFATIDFRIEKEAGLLKPGQVDYSRNFHRLWREQVEQQYQTNGLAKLKKSLENLTVIYKITGDIDFVKYIKEKTGYNYDLFGNIYERIDTILARKKIANRKERKDVATMIELYRRTSIGQENAHVLHNMCIDYDCLQRKEAFPRNHVFWLLEVNSPDNKRYVTMYESHYAANPSTIVNISFESGVTSSVYAAKGVNLGIKIHWKDDNTIVIKLNKDYETFIKDTLKQHLRDIIKVEYPES